MLDLLFLLALIAGQHFTSPPANAMTPAGPRPVPVPTCGPGATGGGC